jgi:hypothetical protein
MLTAYIDESCTTDEKGGLFVMAGFIATPSQWQAFSEDWTNLLTLRSAHYRQLDEFKMAEMAKSDMHFEQCMFFYRAIERHLTMYVSCTVRMTDLREAHSQITWPDWLDNVELLRNEYFTGFSQIVWGLPKFQAQLGLNQPVELVFDEYSNRKKCEVAWRIMKQFGDPTLRPMFAPGLRFADSKATPPLQAADLLAYWVRESALKQPVDASRFQIDFPWTKQSKGMKGLTVFCTRDMMLRNFRSSVLACSLLRCGARPEITSAVLRPDIHTKA